ncbi:histone-like nucleoid-structuring protein Lsr2 [Fodinicola feengrottensis]|uniref:histone-like nucleoid-structuring protein Lsr2 n=1 Tax=Fodinicola feengrottensis TaxID=435914 RepID=UPI0013D37FBE|nr:Lsr2 family protein [Fodinicola feengrottensis]
MAQRTEIILIDDVDGGKADETIRFALDGVAYEIDLSNKNAAKLRDQLATYVSVARKAGKARAPTRPAVRPAPTVPTVTADREQNQAIRAWARKKGLAVSDRGRIPAEIIEQYHSQS